MTNKPNLRCPTCGYEMWAGPVKSPVEVSVLWFCPVDGQALDRLDPLGALEPSGGTFDEFVERPNVLRIPGGEA